jgi:hypothetical protein
MAGHLQYESAIPALVQEAAFSWTFNRQSAKHKWSRGKSTDLRSGRSIRPDNVNRFQLATSLLREE